MTKPSPLAGLQAMLQPSRALSPAETALQNRLAFLVGCCAIALPATLWLAAFHPNVCMRDSISHFYYDPFLGSVFVGILFFIGGFMIALTGENALEKYGSGGAGLGAFALAVFPTSGDGCEGMNTFSARAFSSMTRVEAAADPAKAVYDVAQYPGGAYFAVFDKAENFHLYGAAFVFVFLGLYCLFVLARVVEARHKPGGKLRQSKRKRNRLYRACGTTILACVAVLGAKGQFLGEDQLAWWNARNLTFYVEALALLAFAAAWFAKGRAFQRLNDSPPETFQSLTAANNSA